MSYNLKQRKYIYIYYLAKIAASVYLFFRFVFVYPNFNLYFFRQDLANQDVIN